MQGLEVSLRTSSEILPFVQNDNSNFYLILHYNFASVNSGDGF